MHYSGPCELHAEKGIEGIELENSTVHFRYTTTPSHHHTTTQPDAYLGGKTQSRAGHLVRRRRRLGRRRRRGGRLGLGLRLRLLRLHLLALDALDLLVPGGRQGLHGDFLGGSVEAKGRGSGGACEIAVVVYVSKVAISCLVEKSKCSGEE
jgi:hypothetical protein